MPRSGPKQQTTSSRWYELEVIPGLEAIAVEELRRVARRVTIEPGRREGLIAFGYDGDPAALLDLGTVLAVYERRFFPIPRPKALLGQQHLDALLALIADVRALHGRDAFQTFRLSAAGQDSSVLQRLREELAARTGLEDVADEGDLLLRLRRPLDGSDGWEVLIRLSPRPLSTRAWRVCNLPGAINASVARAMALLTLPHPDDAVLNLLCGSGTLLIERLLHAPARLAIGCDTDAFARRCAIDNIAAADVDQIAIEAWDAGDLPTPDGWADAVLADLPFGQLVGSHEGNVELYPRILREAARVTIGGGVFVAITGDIRLWERLVADAAAEWTLDLVLPIKLPFASGYLHPRIYRLRRK
jgi:tRNA (guanine6-N2)-methyltransferase